MKLLVLFFVAAVWLQLPAGGEAGFRISLGMKQPANKRSSSISNEESAEDSSDSSDSDEGPDVSASDAVRTVLRKIFKSDLWRHAVLALASDETFADPTFRAKWRITEEDDEEKKEHSLDRLSDETRQIILDFIESNEWKALLALASTKEELLDPTYREQWDLEDFSEDIEDTHENGNFFEGPQWKVFVKLNEMDDENRDDWARATVLMLWFMKTAEDFMELK